MSTYTTYISQQQIRWSTCWRAGKVEFIQGMSDNSPPGQLAPAD